MIVLDLFSTFIEDYILAYTVLAFFRVKNNIWRHRFSLSFLCMAETFFFHNILEMQHIAYFLILLLTVGAYITLLTKGISVYTILIPLFSITTIFVSSSIALLLVSEFYNFDYATVFLRPSAYIISVIISRLLIFVMNLTLLFFFRKETFNKRILKYWIYVPFLSISIIIFSIIIDAITNKKTAPIIFEELFLGTLILVAFSFLIFNLIYKQDKENENLAKQILKTEYNDKLYELTRRSLEKVNADKHMMLYSLINIKNQLTSNNIKEAEMLIDLEMKKYLNYRFISSTNNYYFDYDLTNKIYEFDKKDYQIKTVLSVNQHDDLLMNEPFVDDLLELIEQILSLNTNYRKFQIFMEKHQQYLTVKIMSDYPFEMDHEQITLYTNPHLVKSEITIYNDTGTKFSFLFKD